MFAPNPASAAKISAQLKSLAQSIVDAFLAEVRDVNATLGPPRCKGPASTSTLTAGSPPVPAFQVTLASDRLLSIVESDYLTNACAAHGDDEEQSWIFDLATGRLITREALFRPGADYPHLLAGPAVRALQRQALNPPPDAATVVAAFLSANGMPGTIFDLRPDGLEIRFGQGSIGPHAAGIITVTLSYDVLDEILDPQYLPKRLVVLGDSYASGEGTYNNGTDSSVASIDYYPGTATSSDKCHRSPGAYAPLLGVADHDFVACSGATTDEIRSGRGEPSQLGVLDSAVGTVILSAGGDDVGFSTVLGECTDIPIFRGRSHTDCQKAVIDARAKIPAALRSLANLYDTIESRTGGAHLVVVGYPKLFPEGGHFGCNWVDEPRQKIINDATDYFVDQIKATVGRVHGATFVDVRQLFTGHEVCGSTNGAFINDLQTDMGTAHNCPEDYLVEGSCSQSYHPDVAAYRAEADLLGGLIGAATGGSGTPASPSGTASGKQADCYDINSAGIDSQPMAGYCQDALRTVGFSATAHTNATANDALRASRGDAVFFAVGHSASNCHNEWDGDGHLADPNEATGAAILMPGTSNPSFLTGPHDLGQGKDDNCFPGVDPADIAQEWATPEVIGHAKLVVLQACETLKPTFAATDGRQLVSIGQEAFDAGAQIVVGFTQEIEFQGNYGRFGTDYGIPGPYRPRADTWSHTFWSGLQAGAPVYMAARDATVEVTRYTPSGGGYQSLKILTRPGAPVTLQAVLQAGP